MKRRLILVAYLCVAFGATSRAEAGWLHTLICDGLKATPGYWEVYGAVEGLKAAGAITSEMECLDLGDTINDFSVPTGTFKDCVCEAIGWPNAGPPDCPDAHNACTTGVALSASTSMMSCKPTATDDVAGKVCMVDSFCCQTAWDSICVSEAQTAFWNAMDAEVQTIVDRMDLTCDQKDQYIATLQVEANADAAVLSCLGTKTYPSNCGTRSYFQFSFVGKCMGVAAGNLSNNTNIVPWSCNAQPPSYAGATDQAWTIDLNDCATYEGFQYCSVRDGLNYNKCLGTRAGSTNNGTNLVIWDCLGQTHPDQYWNVTLGGDGFWYWVNLASAKAGGFLGIHENSNSFNLGGDTQSTELPVTP